ncbi:MAG: CGNR zinc finger domain-containing protein [Thermoleophilia bacterium]|nr:CGNR zinc finger domain-containing protein [Thermoleophilia bacterium]
MEKRIETISAEVMREPRIWESRIELSTWDGAEDPNSFRRVTPPEWAVSSKREHGPWRAVSSQSGDVPGYGDKRIIRPLHTSLVPGRVPTWQEVRQLHFAFLEGDWTSVRAFYAECGPLGDPAVTELAKGGERVGWAKAALDWFRTLTVLARYVREGWASQLREEYLGPPKDIPPHVARKLLYLVGPHPHSENQHRYSIYIDWLPRESGQGLRSPRTDQEVFATTWTAIVRAIEEELGNIPLAPVSTDFTDNKFPQVKWGFFVDGALQAAFLDWFFREFHTYRFATCARPGCENPVLGRQRKYCSSKCADRDRVARYRNER